MSDAAFTVTPKPVPPELADEFQPARYPDITPITHNWVSLADRLDHASREQLMQLAHGGIGEPDTSPVSQVNAALDMDAL